MKSFNRIFAFVIALMAVIIITANIIVLLPEDTESGRPYRVEISRIAFEIEQNGFDGVDLSEYEYVTNVEKCCDEFYKTQSDYSVLKINDVLYRFDYTANKISNKKGMLITMNIIIGIMSVTMIIGMLYIRQKILRPFEMLTDVPYELSKGNLTSPIKENKSRFFGRFIWGVDLLRVNIEQQKQRELALQRDKKVLLLSLSHDIKTPLSAIKLYSKALSKGLYTEKEKQHEISEKINAKADEIEGYVSQIITASREDFLSLDVKISEFYLTELVSKIKDYYSEKLSFIKTDFTVGKYINCLIKADLERSIEVFQNIIENAVKYGDGKSISVDFFEEDGCILIAVKNSGCTMSDTELPHIFESFWRGSNSQAVKGSGLGLYICRQLMLKMNGDIFAEVKDENMIVTVVFNKA